MTVNRRPLDSTACSKEQATDLRTTTRLRTWGRCDSKEQLQTCCTTNLAQRATVPPVRTTRQGGNEPLRHARESAAAGCGGPEPAVTRGRHVSTCHITRSPRHPRGGDRPQQRSGRRSVARVFVRKPPRSRRGCPRRRHENVRTRDPDVAAATRFLKGNAETSWVSLHRGGARRFVTATAVRLSTALFRDRTTKRLPARPLVTLARHARVVRGSGEADSFGSKNGRSRLSCVERHLAFEGLRPPGKSFSRFRSVAARPSASAPAKQVAAPRTVRPRKWTKAMS